jgi:hypothetical protein
MIILLGRPAHCCGSVSHSNGMRMKLEGMKDVLRALLGSLSQGL